MKQLTREIAHQRDIQTGGVSPVRLLSASGDGEQCPRRSLKILAGIIDNNKSPRSAHGNFTGDRLVIFGRAQT